MNKLWILILAVMATAGVGQAQDLVTTNLGWFPIGYYDYQTNEPPDDDGAVQVGVNLVPGTPPTPPSIAEVITPDIQALADGLQDDPLKIFNYVHDHIRYSLYFGSKKGAELTWLEKSGNDFDQSALLVALLRAAGYTNAAYQFGWMPIPFDNPDGSHRDLHHWLGLDFTNSWSTTSSYLYNLFVFWRSYPNNVGNYSTSFGDNYYAFQRVWVTVTVGGTNYLLDPAFKVSEPINGISLVNAIGGSASSVSNTLMTVAGGLDVGNITTNFYCTNLNEAAIRSTLTGYTTNLLSYVQSNYPNANVEEILSGQSIVPSTNTALSQCFPFEPTNIGAMPVVSWVNEPTNLMSILKINFAAGSKTCQWFMPQLQGQRLGLNYGASTVQLWQEDTNIASGSFSGYDTVTLTMSHPRGSWNTTNNAFTQAWYTISGPEYYYPNANYAISYVFDPDWGWLQARQKKLEGYRQQGLANTNRDVITETLNIMALTWQLEVGDLSKVLGVQAHALPMFYQRVGRMGQEAGRGYYVDIAYMTTGTASSVGASCDYTCDPNEQEWFDQFAYFGSAMEHGMIEQLQSSNLVAGSTIKVIEMANTNHEAIYIANATNWAKVETVLTNYSTASLYSSYIGSGYTLLLPQNGKTAMSPGTNGWAGQGYMARLPNNGGTYMIIGPVFGGYAGDLGATVDPGFIDYSGNSQPLYFNSSPVSVPNLTSADPVDMANGTFQVSAADLSIGQTEPKGLNFSRYYNTTRRNSNPAGLAPGWLHNYYINAATISAPQACLGGTTPAQATAMLAATASAISVYYGNQPDPKNWTVTALIAKWGVDQLTAKAVSVSLGQDTLQFIEQPDGSFTPPANCTMTLTQGAGGAYVLQERHGRTYYFNTNGWATNISDPYGQSMTLTYNASNWVTQVTDWKGRSLTFNYSTNNPVRLTNVVDSTGRKVGFGYSSSNDLAFVVDPDGNTNRYLYDTNHQITATFDANNQVVVSNVYNSFGRVTTQYTQGSTNKIWKIYWSGWQTVSQDPAGAQQTFTYDDKTRVIGQQDAFGNRLQKFYDGQDHVVMAVSPLGETNQFVYDVNHNLLATVDPLGYSNQFVYDNNNNLTEAIDAVGNVTTYGYNAQFSLIGQTNGAGDWVNMGCNADGTLAGQTNSGGGTTFTYDTYGQLSGVAYPGGLGSESFVNNALGDVTSHTDARGTMTVFKYNNRRQLTNTVTGSSLTNSAVYDAVGNVASIRDARGNVTSNTWSVTQHLLKTTLPTVAAGTPVTTNGYDNRDMLVRTADPLGHALLTTNDLVGRPISLTDPIARTTQIFYNGDGRKLATVNAANETNSQIWDARGKLVQSTDGAGHFSTSSYDGAGNQIILTNRNGNAWQFKFDGANRLTNMITPMLRSSSVAFDHRGLPTNVVDFANRATSLGYDGKGRLTNRTDGVGTTLYSYDPGDNLTNVYENGLSNSWAYDAFNRVTNYQDACGHVIEYRYDQNGNLTNLVYPGGKNVYYAYDSLNRLTTVTDWAQRQTTVSYDLAGHLTGIARPNGTYRTMQYDAAGQVTNILEQTALGFPLVMELFAWTNSGNMAWEFIAPTSHVASLPVRQMGYDSDNRLNAFEGPTMNVFLKVATDGNGNLAWAPLTNEDYVNYAYDARDRLTNVVGVTCAYDPAGNRVGVISGTTNVAYVVNPNSGLPQALMRTVTVGTNSVTNYYVYGVGLMYQVTESATATNTLTYHYDYRGSTVALTDSGGNLTDRMEYSLYGTLTYRVGTNDTPFLFNGQYGVMSDPDGLLYMQARYYNPYLCRFISADPSGFGGGLNMYAYANGNPVSNADPFGLGALSEAGIAAASLYNAPTPEQAQMQDELTAFADISTLGLANITSEATTGNDLWGSQVAPEEQTSAVIELAATLALLPLGGVEGAGDDLAVEVAENLGQDAAETKPAGSLTQVSYGEGLSTWALTLRYSRSNFNPVGNVAVFQYLDEAGETQYVMGFAQRPIHSESIVGNGLLDIGVRPSQVTAIYSEFAPCTRCTPYLEQTFPNIPVSYSFPLDTEGKAMKADAFLGLFQ